MFVARVLVSWQKVRAPGVIGTFSCRRASPVSVVSGTTTVPVAPSSRQTIVVV